MLNHGNKKTTAASQHKGQGFY
uniref:Uncharacterized protein n=1 Tax=Arundo donax TaxID=35708 RepID=A0A0A9BDT4_ARUDO